MCLIFVGLKVHPSYKFILAGNRDEFYQRRTAPANFWEENKHIVAGKDLEAGGTWLGMNTNGKISMVTNYRDPKNIDPKAPSRGQLVYDYLAENQSAENYLSALQPKAKQYNGFNLLLGDPDKLWYLSNYKDGIDQLDHGYFGLSNHLLETPWPKVKRGKEKFQQAVSDKEIQADQLFDMLYDEQRANDEQLPDTGIGLERERALSSMFIKTSGYGTRCSTVILVDQNNQVTFSERVYNLEDFSYKTNTFNFQIAGQ